MKLLIKLLLISLIATTFNCTVDERPAYDVCEDGQIINESLRENAVRLSIEDWPTEIRGYIAGEFPRYYVEDMVNYTFQNLQYTIAQLNNGGYVMFDENRTFICADNTFNGGSRLDISPTDTMVIDTMNMDTTDMPVDTIVGIVEMDTCDMDVISFQRQILPIIVSNCAYSGCHDAITHEEGVILETYNNIRSQSNVNNPNNSKIIKTFLANPNSNKYMPPKPAISMTSEQIQLIRDWMSQGALNTDCNVACDSRNISFTKDIFPLLQSNCIGCHQTANDQDGVNLDSYEQIIFYANNGDLLGSIKHDILYKPMPELANKLTDCQIAQIENWIEAGAKND